MTVVIRPAFPSDVAELVAVENAVFDADRISRKGFLGMVASSSATILVACDGGALAGYCALLFRAGSKRARLYSLASVQGQSGVGRQLLAAAEAAAAGRGCTALRLEVRADNARAITLYERTGYRMFGQVPDYYADGATALRFEKPVPSLQSPTRGSGMEPGIA